MLAGFARGLAVAVLLLSCARHAHAHDESVSTSAVEIAGRTIVWKIDVGVGGLGKVVALPAAEGALTNEGLQSAAGSIAAYFARTVVVSADGHTLTATPGQLEPRFEPNTPGGPDVLARAVQTLTFTATQDIATVSAKLTPFASITRAHRALVRVRWGGDYAHFIRLGPTDLSFSRATLNPWAVSRSWEFLQWGVEHIFLGFDHIAFLLALLLAVPRVRGLLVIVSAFTLAHSLTLLLSALGVVSISSRLTEALIAASIVYVAAENLMRGQRSLRQRGALTFAFGLVHGLGFATELRHRLAELSGSVVAPVLSFNLGVELGQLAIVAVVFPVLVRLRRAPTPALSSARQRRLMTWGSLPLLLAGVAWFIDRMSG